MSLSIGQEERAEECLLALEDPGHVAADDRRQGDSQSEEEYDLEDFVEFHGAVPDTAPNIENKLTPPLVN